MRPRIWREDGWWHYAVPHADGAPAFEGRAGTWRRAYDRTCELVREELARVGVEVPAA